MPTALKLTVRQGDAVIAQETFERDIVKIGRLATAHLKLDDPKVSRIHAVIEATHDGVGYAIIDMGSAEGTLLNGKKVSKERLSDGDELLLGDLRVLVNMALDAHGLEGPTDDVDVAPALRPPLPVDVSWAQDAFASMPPASSAGPPAGASPPTHAPAAAHPAPRSQPAAVVMERPDPPAAGATPEVKPTEISVGPASTPEAAVVAESAIGVSSVPGMPRVPDPSADLLLDSEGMPVGSPAMGPSSAVGGRQGPVYRPLSATDPWGSVPNNLASTSVSPTARVLEVRTVWGTSVLDTFTVARQPTITIGDHREVVGWGPFQRIKSCDIQVPSQGLPFSEYVLAELAEPQGTHYQLNIPPNLTGHIQRADGALIPLAYLYEGGEGAFDGTVPGGVRYLLRPAETVYLVYGNVILQIRYIRSNRLVAPGFWSEQNYAWLNILLLAFFLHAILIFAFHSRSPEAPVDGIATQTNRFAQIRLTPAEKKKVKEKLARLKAKQGKRQAPKGKSKAGAVDHHGPEQGRRSARQEKAKQAAKSVLDQLIGTTPGKSARRQIMGSGEISPDLRAAAGRVRGRKVGTASGLGGLQERGRDLPNDSLDMDPVELGALATRGRGGGLQGSVYGEAAAKLGVKKEREIEITPGRAVIQGSLDRDLVRRVIRRNIHQIRYCYERELQISQGLFGKVAARFVISPNGRVQQAKVEETTLNNATVEACVLRKIRLWRFPKPKGGGFVVVRYPFIFKRSG